MEDWSWPNPEEYTNEWHDDEGSFLVCGVARPNPKPMTLKMTSPFRSVKDDNDKDAKRQRHGEQLATILCC